MYSSFVVVVVEIKYPLCISDSSTFLIPSDILYQLNNTNK